MKMFNPCGLYSNPWGDSAMFEVVDTPLQAAE